MLLPSFLALLSCACVLTHVHGFKRPLVVGHRGVAYLPELTLAAQSMAYAYGADIVEIDVCLSRDNQLIVIHGNRSRSSKMIHWVVPFW